MTATPRQATVKPEPATRPATDRAGATPTRPEAPMQTEPRGETALESLGRAVVEPLVEADKPNGPNR